jgi:hypothetical protein
MVNYKKIMSSFDKIIEILLNKLPFIDLPASRSVTSA